MKVKEVLEEATINLCEMVEQSLYMRRRRGSGWHVRARSMEAILICCVLHVHHFSFWGYEAVAAGHGGWGTGLLAGGSIII
jgi:hypothetical protein